MGHVSSMTVAAVLLVCCALGSWRTVQAADPELTTDFAVPAGQNATDLDGGFFTSTALRVVNITSQDFANVKTVNLVTNPFPALQGLGVSSALLTYPPGAVNPPHTHPRGTELLYVIEGCLSVGLVDAANNKLFTQTLEPGDLFVFPRGLVHFQINLGTAQTVKAFAAFSSSNAGLVRLPNNLFNSNIPDDVLAKSFGVSGSVIDTLQAATVT